VGKSRMTIGRLIKDYAKEHGYSGLFNDEGECGCSLEEHFPCDNVDMNCQFGYVTECVNCDKKDSKEGCRLNDEGCDMCIRLHKPKKNPYKFSEERG